MSKVQELVERYAGQRVKVIAGNYEGWFGIITGWYDDDGCNYVLLECIDSSKVLSSNYDGGYTFVRPHSGYPLHYIETDHFNDIEWPAPITTAPDDCDDCGAVGEEKCKPNCSNRE